MFENYDAAAGPDDADQFGKGKSRIRDRTKNQSRKRGIETISVEREKLGVGLNETDRFGFRAGEKKHFDRQLARDSVAKVRVILKIGAGAGTDLENVRIDREQR